MGKGKIKTKSTKDCKPLPLKRFYGSKRIY